jgi:hypothetical protein
MLNQKTSWIEQADENVNIADLLTSIGVFVPDTIRDGGNKKVHCPFGFYHSDGGNAKAMKVYYSANSAYCFSCSKRYSPVSLAAAHWDCSFVAAAMRLLEDAGFKPKTLKERWTEATTPVENKPDLIALADALKMFCSGVSGDWKLAQYSDDVAIKLSRCLELLNNVKTDEDAEKWLSACKIIMRKLLESR